jgi:hypothetical protein
LAIHVGQLLRRRVRSDLEERVAGLDLVPDVDEAALHEAGDLRLDREFLARLDLSDGERLLGDRALFDRHQLRLAVALAAPGQRVDAGRHRHEDDEQQQCLEEFGHSILPGKEASDRAAHVVRPGCAFEWEYAARAVKFLQDPRRIPSRRPVENGPRIRYCCRGRGCA